MTIVPGGRTVEIDPGETLLDALRRHDEPISYSCRDGRCGLCRCSISLLARGSGELPVGLNDDSAQSVLACQTRPTTECLVELPNPEDLCVIEPQIVGARIISVNKLAERVYELVLSPKKPLQFVEGQHFEVSFESNLVRSLSIASLPTEPQIRIHVQRHPVGRLSEYIQNTELVGQTLKLRGPLGSVYLRAHCRRPILCVSHSTGLAPMISLIRAIGSARLLNPVYIYVGFTLHEDIYGLEALREAASHLRVLKRLRIVVASGANEKERGQIPGLLTDALAPQLAELRECRVYSFGSPYAVETVSWSLIQAGVDPERLHAEPFLYANY